MLSSGDPGVGVALYVAQLWLHGHLPYLVAWEYRPPGLFAYYAAALVASGGRATLAVEALATLSVFSTAMLLYRLAPLIDRTRSTLSGRFAALFSVLLATENEGYLGDAELLLAPFITAAVLLACGESVTLGAAALSGLLAGFAVQLKLSAAPLLAVPAIVMARRARRPLAIVAAYALAALSPFAFGAALYASAGALPAFLDANAGATLRRVVGLHRGIAQENFGWFVAQLRILAPALELCLFALPASANAKRIASWGWFAAALLSVTAIGEFYDRQFILIEPPVALLGGIGLRVCIDALRSRPLLLRAAPLLVFVVTFALHDYWETEQAVALAYRRVVLREPAYDRDMYAALVHAIRRQAGGSLFVIQESPLLYYDLDVASPTRFPDTDHLLDPRMTQMTGIDGRREVARIFSRDPRIVVVGDVHEARFDPATVGFIERRLARDYRVVEIIDPRTTLYVLSGPLAAYPSRPR